MNTTKRTRSVEAKKFGGPPSPLPETEPPIYRQIIQYSYYIQNTNPDMKLSDVYKTIAKDLLSIWVAVNPRLPHQNMKYVLKIVSETCSKARQINKKKLHKNQKTNLTEKLDKLFDISLCKCDLPSASCKSKFVNCHIPNCDGKHIICTCPLNQKVTFYVL